MDRHGTSADPRSIIFTARVFCKRGWVFHNYLNSGKNDRLNALLASAILGRERTTPDMKPMKKILDAKTIPTALRREDAAMHCGVSASYFDRMVREAVFPPPRLIGPAVKVWMRQELDEALFALPTEHGEVAFENPCDRLLGPKP